MSTINTEPTSGSDSDTASQLTETYDASLHVSACPHVVGSDNRVPPAGKARLLDDFVAALRKGGETLVGILNREQLEEMNVSVCASQRDASPVPLLTSRPQCTTLRIQVTEDFVYSSDLPAGLKPLCFDSVKPRHLSEGASLHGRYFIARVGRRKATFFVTAVGVAPADVRLHVHTVYCGDKADQDEE